MTGFSLASVVEIKYTNLPAHGMSLEDERHNLFALFTLYAYRDPTRAFPREAVQSLLQFHQTPSCTQH
jgi:hypothetical protein